ncbi:hypothetical protein LTV02_20395 [Nocardia yamanashiensis]|uniref:Rv3212 family protein n=1 Tax=Nocardia yamanashiensis TaxID=209247 RepID=UPI001E4A7E6D|nr:hypothetical protein [Nocardia yamanashiensis]UGT38517.1 hypothetical protein LTV02_20395 [Nocardia yamanashiensis]
MLAPERRTRADIRVAVAIAVLVAVVAGVVWWKSEARKTESVTAGQTLSALPTPERVPEGVHELWSQADGAAARAIVVGGVMVTGDGGTVTGRNPLTGEQVWKYQRDLPLCGLESQFGTVVATYKVERGCSETTLLNAETGQRLTARSSYMDDRVRLSVDGTYVLAYGDDRLEMWRSDLVRTLEYGYVDAPVNPHTQQRSGCTLVSAGSAPSRLAVLERCPGESTDRLTVLNPAPKDATVPEEYSSHRIELPGAGVDGARVLAVSDSRIAVYFNGSGSTAPEFVVFDTSGNIVGTHPLSAPMSDQAMVSRLSTSYFVFTGNSLIALNSTTFDPLWGIPNALGTPALMSGKLLVPVADGLNVLDPVTGAQTGRIAVQRSDYHGEPISLAVLGPIIAEQRGGKLYALGTGAAPTGS